MITTRELLLKIIQKFCVISTNKDVNLETLVFLFNDLKDEYKIEAYNNQKKDKKTELSPSMVNDITELLKIGSIKGEELPKSQKIIGYNKNENYTITISGALVCNMIEIPKIIQGPLQKVLEKYIK